MMRFVPWAAMGLALLVGCAPGANEPRVVVYVALDREFSEPILEEFDRTSSMRAAPKYDVESTKSVGLANAIIQETARPRCDVFWNNEILNTLRLERLGLLEVYVPPTANDFPDWARSDEGRWHGFAARARILLVNTNLVALEQRPKSVRDLAAPEWKGRIGFAKPLFGTTATHAACLFALWGPERAKDFFNDLKANDVQVLSGNRQVASAVAAGELAFGLTDTDDAYAELDRRAPVAIVYPDSQPGEDGTLFIPNVVAILKNSPHPAEARKLVDYLLTAETEDKLAAGPSGQIPLSARASKPPRGKTPATVQAMDVDFSEAAKAWDETAAFLRATFTE